ncbi:hypothetical protein SAMN05216327_11813 [Dyadobacter sp. SG02]|uniref:hypothetical protein n=1 Tax=Dyadobacter sp. SG02 TaxID=1855291 RepID=UPI0008AE5764|nr:hypothetical protein [Dyadobacter sp. SG02]SEJ74390.1 hypothetical protein SAMN05216327_11813 [Dyadobacter sp. SG02]
MKSRLLLASVIVFFMSCKKDEPSPTMTEEPAFTFQFTQGKNFQALKKSLEFEAGTKLKGYDDKILFLNEELPDSLYTFQTEGAPQKFKVTLHVSDNGTQDYTQFKFRVLKKGKQVLNMSHVASGAAEKSFVVDL